MGQECACKYRLKKNILGSFSFYFVNHIWESNRNFINGEWNINNTIFKRISLSKYIFRVLIPEPRFFFPFLLHRVLSKASIGNKWTRCRIRSKKCQRLPFFLLSKLQKHERCPWAFPRTKISADFRSREREERDAGYQGYNFRDFHSAVNPGDVKSLHNNKFIVCVCARIWTGKTLKWLFFDFESKLLFTVDAFSRLHTALLIKLRVSIVHETLLCAPFKFETLLLKGKLSYARH